MASLSLSPSLSLSLFRSFHGSEMSGAEMEKMRQWDLEMNPVLEIPLPAGEATIRTGGGGDGESARE